MAKLDDTVEVRAADPKCDHAHQTSQNSSSGVFYICQGCGAFIDYSKRINEQGNVDAA